MRNNPNQPPLSQWEREKRAQKKPAGKAAGFFNPAMTYSPTQLPCIPSALKGLTSVFGMGTGVTPSL